MKQAQLSERFRGKDVVINLIGILNERGFGGRGFRRAHTELTRIVLEAARSAGVPRLLQVSALKAAVDAPSYYLRSKGEAEKLIREQTANSGLDHPAAVGDVRTRRLIFEPLLRPARRRSRFAFPLARPNARFQPVFVDDVVDAVLRCLRGGATSRQTYELGGPQVYTLARDRRAGREDHRPPALDLRTAGCAGTWLQGLVMDFVPGRPFSSDNYRSLKVDSVCVEDGFAKLKMQSALDGRRRTSNISGAFEDNARLSRDRAAAGRSAAGHTHTGGATAERP